MTKPELINYCKKHEDDIHVFTPDGSAMIPFKFVSEERKEVYYRAWLQLQYRPITGSEVVRELESGRNYYRREVN